MKEKIFECMDMLNQILVPCNVQIGDVIAEDVCGSKVVVTGKVKN